VDTTLNPLAHNIKVRNGQDLASAGDQAQKKKNKCDLASAGIKIPKNTCDFASIGSRKVNYLEIRL